MFELFSFSPKILLRYFIYRRCDDIREPQSQGRNQPGAREGEATPEKNFALPDETGH